MFRLLFPHSLQLEAGWSLSLRLRSLRPLPRLLNRFAVFFSLSSPHATSVSYSCIVTAPVFCECLSPKSRVL